MITRRTKIQLVIFVIITLVGVSYVGARYAQLDRLVVDDAYTVVAHFSDSGGIFAGGEVTYRGVRIGRVDKLELTDEGVDVHLDIDNDEDEIPADAIALVGNRSAVGEQYVELQPQTDDEPYLKDGSRDRRWPTPACRSRPTSCSPTSPTRCRSVDQEALRTTVTEIGRGVRRHRRGPAADHRHRQLLHRRRQRQLRRHHRADRGLQHGAQRPGRLGERAAHLRLAALGLQPGLRRTPTATCARSSTPARSPPTSCAPSSRTTGSTSAS